MAKQTGHRISINDENKLSDDACLVSLRLLKIASQHTDISSLLNALVLEAQNLTGHSAVGLRLLEEDGSSPYRAHIGFKEDLSKSNSHISIELDDCVCTDVIKGSTDPNLSYYTKSGSFLTNSVSDLLSEISKEEKRKIQRACNIHGYESVFLVPIREENRIFGLLHMADTKENMIQPVVVEAMEAAGPEIGLAIQRLRRFEELQMSYKESRERHKEVAALLESSKAVIKYQDFEKASQAIYESCKNLIGATTGYVALKSADGKESKEVVLDVGDHTCNVDTSLPVPIRGLCEKSYSSGKPVYENDFAKSEWTKLIPTGHFMIENILFAPLMFNDKAVGLISLANKPGGFTNNDINVSLAFAEILAIALYNDQLTESLKSKEERYRTITQSASDGIVTVDSKGEITHWNDAAAKIFGYSAKTINGKTLDILMPKRLRQGYKEGFNKLISTGKSKIFGKTVEMTGLRKNGSEFPIEMSISTWKTKEQVYFTGIVRDITNRKSAEETERRLRERQTSILESISDAFIAFDNEWRYIYVNEKAVQILGKKRDELIGNVFWEVFPDFVDTPEGNKFREVKEKQITASYEIYYEPLKTWMNVRVYPRPDGISAYFSDITKVKQEKELSDSLNRINDEISSTLDFDKIMEGVISEASKVIGCDKSVIYLREEDFWIPKHSYNFPSELIGFRFKDEEAQFAVIASKTREPVVSQKVESNEHLRCQLMIDYHLKSILALPLFLREETMGCLLFTYDSETEFSKAEIDFAEKLSVSISLAIENARLYSKEHKIADVLQKAHLKLPKDIEGIEFANIYRSATVEESEVGGDFYDLYELDKDNVAIAVGDVSGKGLEAAELTSVVKNSLRGFAYQGLSPSEVLKKTNLVITKTAPILSFITVFFAILEKSSGLLRYCSAGHLPAIIKKKTFDVEILNAGNTALGVLEDLKYKGDQTKLVEGDTLIVYTDGITEARRDLEFYGEERLMKTIKDLKQVDTEKILKIIYDEVASFSNNDFADDLAILALSLDSTKK